jgi:hypothetical protein
MTSERKNKNFELRMPYSYVARARGRELPTAFERHRNSLLRGALVAIELQITCMSNVALITS